MLYGLSGSSGCGKTTLAKSVAESLGITFMPTSITASANRHGFNPVGVLSIRERLKLQNHLLDDMLELINEAPRPLIIDRTPIDLIGYLLSEFDMHSHMRSTAEEIQEAEAYVGRCLKAASDNFDCIFLVGQLNDYETAATRPAENRAYQTHSHLVMEGALHRLTNKVNHCYIGSTDPESRHDFVHDAIVERLDAIEAMRRSSPHIH